MIPIRLPLPPVIGSLVRSLFESQIRKEVRAAALEGKRDIKSGGYTATAAGWRPPETAQIPSLTRPENPMNLIEGVRLIYAAFGRGDMPAILASLVDDVDCEHDAFPSRVPWLQLLKGRDSVLTFFQALNASVESTRFQPTHFLADGNTAVCLLDVAFTVKATGKRVNGPDEVHIWRGNDQGKVHRFRHRTDTWQCMAALN